MLGRDEGLPHQPPWRADHSVGGPSRTGLRKPADPEPPSGRASCARRRRAVRIRGLYARRPRRERADAGDGGGDRGTAGREPQREMTILEVLVRLMVFGTSGKGAIGAKAYVTVTTTVLPG